MTWRVLEHDDAVWSVSCAADRPPHRDEWRLVLAFRATPSRADVYARADQLSDDALVTVLSRRLR